MAAPDDQLLKEFFAEIGAAERDNEVNRVLSCFKLNPFEQMNLPFDSSIDDVKKQYRKISLMVHPDKCKHPQAKEAFDIIQKAQEQLNNVEERGYLVSQFAAAKEDLLRDHKRKLKSDKKALQSSSSSALSQAVAEFEKSPDFTERWRVKVRELLAESEWRRRKMQKRIKEEEQRIQVDEEETRVKTLKERDHEEKWEKTRDNRVSSWRDFQKKGGKKSTAQLKPPKLKTEDADKSYVQRPVNPNAGAVVGGRGRGRGSGSGATMGRGGGRGAW